jgi:replicative DNA helicase
VTDTLTIPPHDQEAEAAVLGTMLLEHRALAEVCDILKPSDFYSEQNQRLYEVMRRLHEERTPCDLVTVQGALSDQGWLHDVGGAPYLLRLHESAETAAMAGHYAQRVMMKSQQRQLLKLGTILVGKAGSEDPIKLCEQIMREAARIQQGTSDEFVPLSSVLSELIDELERQFDSDKHTWGVPTNIPELDRLISGWTPATYTVLASRPRIGKTALMWQQATQAAEAGHKVAVFSLEMSGPALGRRWLSTKLEIELSQVMAARFARERMEDVVEVSGKAAKWKLWVCERSDLTISQLRAQARRLARLNDGLDIVAVDYLQLLRADGRCASRNEEIGEVSRGLKALAQELRCSLLVLSQLSRDCEREKRWPRLSDLRDSGTIEQDADLVVFLVYPVWDRRWYGTTPEQQREAKGKRIIYVAKQRNGDTGRFEVSWSGAYQRFAGLEERREGDAPYWMSD